MDIYKLRKLLKLKNKQNYKINKNWFYDILNFNVIQDKNKTKKLKEFLKNTKYLPKLISEDDTFLYFEKINFTDIILIENEEFFFDTFIYHNRNINKEFIKYFPDYRLVFDYNKYSFLFSGLNILQIDFEEIIIRHKNNVLIGI